ncbi:uncharacterized protein-like [Hetaerina americana]|uniref:uncharacterized protein-like n=1 Tax=Hetaerina americana TaxID=62018 RepID=UPI003A7F5EEA
MPPKVNHNGPKDDHSHDHAELKSMLETINKTMASFQEELETAKKDGSEEKMVKITSLEERFISFRNGINGDLNHLSERLKDIEERVSRFDYRLDDLEQYSRRNCLLIHGINEEKGENCLRVATDFFINKLKESETADIGNVVNEILSLAKFLGLEMNNNDIDEFVEEHSQKLTTERLMNFHCVPQEEVEVGSLFEEEVTAKQQSSCAISCKVLEHIVRVL